MTDILPCPFCGNPGLSDPRHGFYDPDTNKKAVRCGQCGATGPWVRVNRESEPNAVGQWNRRAALAQQGGVPDEHAETNYDPYNQLANGWNACRAEVLRLNAARPADQDAVDAARYRRLRSRAREVSSWDREGEAGRWSINFFSKRKTMTFDQSVDALAQPEKGT